MTYEEFTKLPIGTVIIDDYGNDYVVSEYYVFPSNPNETFSTIRFHKFKPEKYHIATEEESKSFFEKLKFNGYSWNTETKIVEELPKEFDKILDEAARKYSERFQDEKDKLYSFHGFRNGAMWRDSRAQRLSNDVDGAAELSANDAMIKRQFPSVVYNTGLKCFDHSDLIKQFKAGAEWMAEQGASFNTEVGWIDGPTVLDWPDDILDSFEMGDKVIVQIRKK